MKAILGVLFMLFAAWSTFINVIPLMSQAKIKKELLAKGLGDSSVFEHMAPRFEYHLSMLLTALGAGAVGAFYTFGNPTLINMGGAFVALLGYGAVIQSFRKYDTAAQVAKLGGDYVEYRRTLRFSFFYGMALIAAGLYFAL